MRGGGAAGDDWDGGRGGRVRVLIAGSSREEVRRWFGRRGRQGGAPAEVGS
jgi:hypothetical protein